MKDRFKKLRKMLGLSQEAFGKRIGITKASVSQIENGANLASNSTIKCVAREFGVNEHWLRTGEGAMFEEISRAEKAAQIVGAALGSEDDFILNTFIALGQLSPAEWDIIKKFVKKLNDDSVL